MFFAFATTAQAQSFRAYAGEFLQLGVGARSLALGGTGITYVDDAGVGYWNPAGLSEINYPTISGMHEARFDNTVQHDFGAFAAPLGKDFGIGFTALHIGISNIKDTRSAFIDRNGNGAFDDEDYLDYSKVSSFGNYDWGFLFSLGKKQDSTLSYGATFKLIVRKLDPENSATGIGFDVGVRYRPMENLVLAAVGQDITTTYLTYTSGNKELVAPTLKLGGAYTWDITGTGTHKIMPTIDADIRFENRGKVAEVSVGPLSADFHFGAEYRFKEIVSVRGGYNDLKMFTVGAGIKLPKLAVDYAFQSFSAQDQLGNTHRISFSLIIEQAKWKRGGE